VNFDDYLQQKLDDPEFRQEWEALAPAFQVVCTLIETRNRLGWTQAELAQRMGTTAACVSRAESTGEATPEFLAQFAAAVGGRATLLLELPGREQLPIAIETLAKRRAA
jgi:transcriptional regulator with XRE-family HTH domain